MMPVFHVPQELLDSIVGYIPTDDLDTLKCCSSASRTLAAPARPRVFHTIRLLPPYGDPDSPTLCRKFYKLLQRAPHISAWVKDLRVIDGGSGAPSVFVEGNWLWTAKDSQKSRQWVLGASRTLSLILPLLKNLEQLSIQADPTIRWEKLTRAFKTALKTAAPQLRVIHIRGIFLVRFSELNEILALVATAKVLNGLSITYDIDTPRRRLATLIAPSDWRPQLQSLAFSDYDTSGILTRALIERVNFSYLRFLSVADLSVPELRSLVEAFPIENAVESLKIWFMSDVNSTSQPSPLNLGLASFSHLRSLRVSTHCRLATFQEILQECAQHIRLETVVFEAPNILELQSLDAEAESFQWRLLRDTVRASPVDRVEFLFSHFGYAKYAVAYRDLVKKVLERIEAQDVLIVRDIFPSTTLDRFEDAHLNL